MEWFDAVLGPRWESPKRVAVCCSSTHAEIGRCCIRAPDLFSTCTLCQTCSTSPSRLLSQAGNVSSTTWHLLFLAWCSFRQIARSSFWTTETERKSQCMLAADALLHSTDLDKQMKSLIACRARSTRSSHKTPCSKCSHRPDLNLTYGSVGVSELHFHVHVRSKPL